MRKVFIVLILAFSFFFIGSYLAKQNYSSAQSQNCPGCLGDLYPDNQINALDFGVLARNYGNTCQVSSPTPSASVFTQATPTPTPLPSPSTSTTGWRLFNDQSAFNRLIPSNASYTAEPRIGSFRNGYAEWSAPIYRVPAGGNVPLVTVVVDGSGRTENWPIPTSALPATADDHHMSIWLKHNNIMYEFWNARWQSSTRLNVGGARSFPQTGPDATGISNPTNQTVIAAGFAVTAGMLIKEDYEVAPGQYDQNAVINHALGFALNYSLLQSGGFVPPAVDSETGTGNIPLGARYALARNANVDALTNIHPMAKGMLRAARDYGIYVNDHSSPSLYQGKEVGTIRVEPAMCPVVFNATCDSIISQVQSQIYTALQQLGGLYRVTGVSY